MAIVYSNYPSDPRVRRESEAMQEAGFGVDVICARYPEESRYETVHDVHTHRVKNYLRPGNRISYILNYIHFMMLAFFKLTQLSLKKRIHLIHIHNMPDFLIYTALIHRLFGSKLMLDLHDPSPEMFMTKFELPESHFMIRLMKWIECGCIRLAHVVLTPNIAFKRIFESRCANAYKIHIVMNSPLDTIFDPDKVKSVKKDENRFTLMFHGSVVHRYGLDLAIRAVNKLKDQIPELHFEVYGDGEFLPECIALTERSGLSDRIHFHGMQSQETIAEAIYMTDLGIIPNRISVFTQINFPTRIFEYLSMGKPVIAPRTKGILDYFSDEDLCYYTHDSPDEMAALIQKACTKRHSRCDKLDNAIRIYQNHRWEVQKQTLLTQVNHMLNIDKV